MRLTSARVTNYKSIEDAGEVLIEPTVTVFVGQNESGKTAFLEALDKARSVEAGVEYNYIEDYPRKSLTEYEPSHLDDPADVATLRYELTGAEVRAINDDLGIGFVRKKAAFTVTHRIDNTFRVSLNVPEGDFVNHTVAKSSLPREVKLGLKDVETLDGLFSRLAEIDLNEEGQSLLTGLQEKFPPSSDSGRNRLELYVWVNHLKPAIPKFVYFDQYKLLPGKINLDGLQERQERGQLLDGDRAVLGLLRLANIDLATLSQARGFEAETARLEGINIKISDEVFKYWTQNQRGGAQELEVQFNIKADPDDIAPFNRGNNLYIRIRSIRHRVSVPFDKRSRGFIWFFSFLVWFGSIRKQVEAESDLVLLLDEPGLSLHALAQDNLLNYIDDLAARHQVLYATHSPFMVRSERLHQVRSVQDLLDGGTSITSNLAEADDKTLFPLQAALGYSIAQNLFVAKKNLLVEGPSDLVYLKFFSERLKAVGRQGLADDIVIVPVGGLDKLATFVALLGANQLEIVVLHDWNRTPHQKLGDLVRTRVISEREVLHYGMFRSGSAAGGSKVPATDVEDYFTEALYLNVFNAGYARELGGAKISVKDLEPGDRIVDRLARTLAKLNIEVRPSGGFNHYRPATELASHPPSKGKISDRVLGRFEALFIAVNKRLA